jgi:hypothetical protein
LIKPYEQGFNRGETKENRKKIRDKPDGRLKNTKKKKISCPFLQNIDIFSKN